MSTQSPDAERGARQGVGRTQAVVRGHRFVSFEPGHPVARLLSPAPMPQPSLGLPAHSGEGEPFTDEDRSDIETTDRHAGEGAAIAVHPHRPRRYQPIERVPVDEDRTATVEGLCGG
jgi:hypothetical protein